MKTAQDKKIYWEVVEVQTAQGDWAEVHRTQSFKEAFEMMETIRAGMSDDRVRMVRRG